MTEVAAMNAETTMADGRTLLITGATGNQGGATIAELLRRPVRWRIRALGRELITSGTVWLECRWFSEWRIEDGAV